MLFNAEIRAPIVEDAERIFRLATLIDDPNDEDELSMFVLAVAKVFPRDVDAPNTLPLVVVIFELAVTKLLPNDEELFSTLLFVVFMFVLAVASEFPREDEELRTLVLVVRIELDSELEAFVTKLLVPVIAARTVEIGLVRLSTSNLPIVPGVLKVEVAAFHI